MLAAMKASILTSQANWLPRINWKYGENVALKNEIEETANSSVNGDLELMSSQFELDFRLFEIEMNLDMPMMAMMRGVKSMAMTVYQQAKTLILAGKYEREDMEYKLNRYMWFNNQVVKVVDLANSLNGEVFQPLKDIDFFKRFTIKFNTIEWENGADIAPEYLYEHGVTV